MTREAPERILTVSVTVWYITEGHPVKPKFLGPRGRARNRRRIVEGPMDKTQFALLRKRLGATQRRLSQVLGVSLRAIHAYEQGWRKVPAHVERQVLFLLAWRRGIGDQDPCWEIRSCPLERRENCPAWQFRMGQLCWFVNGTFCEGTARADWDAKMAVCWECDILRRLVGPGGRAPGSKGGRSPKPAAARSAPRATAGKTRRPRRGK